MPNDLLNLGFDSNFLRGQLADVGINITPDNEDLSNNLTIDGSLQSQNFLDGINGYQFTNNSFQLNGDGTINGSLIVTGTLSLGWSNITDDDGNKPADNADVTLSAVNGGLTVTGGGITLSSGGSLKGGQTDYNTGTGFFIGYSGGAYKQSIGVDTGNRLTFDGTTLTLVGRNNLNYYQFTAGQDLTAGDAIIIGDGTSTFEIDISTLDQATRDIYGANWWGQAFTTSVTADKITKVSLYLGVAGTPPGNLDVSLYATSSGLPTGSPLATKSVDADVIITGTAWYDFTFASAVTVSASTTYAIVVSLPSGVNSSNDVVLHVANVSGSRLTSTDSGSNWSSEAGAVVSKYTEQQTETGKVYKSDASLNDLYANNFIGFATETVNAEDSVLCIINGLVSGLSGITVGSTYYLSDTSGAISTSAGSQSRKIGIGFSSTELLLKQDNA